MNIVFIMASHDNSDILDAVFIQVSIIRSQSLSPQWKCLLKIVYWDLEDVFMFTLIECICTVISKYCPSFYGITQCKYHKKHIEGICVLFFFKWVLFFVAYVFISWNRMTFDKSNIFLCEYVEESDLNWLFF